MIARVLLLLLVLQACARVLNVGNAILQTYSAVLLCYHRYTTYSLVVSLRCGAAIGTTGEYCWMYVCVTLVTVLQQLHFMPVLTVLYLCLCLSESAGGVIGLPSPLLPLPLPLSDTSYLHHAHTCPGHAPRLHSATPSNHDAICTACRQGNSHVEQDSIT